MNPSPSPALLLYIKLAIVGAAVVGVFVLAGMREIDPTTAVTLAVAAVTGLSVALGIASSGSAQALGIRAAANTQAAAEAPEVTPAATPSAKAVLRGFARLRALFALSIVGVAAFTAVAVVAANGCALFSSTEAPIADCTGRVLADAAKGDSVTQILEDVGGPCALDVGAVLAILLASKDAHVMASAAYAEASRAKSRLSTPSFP